MNAADGLEPDHTEWELLPIALEPLATDCEAVLIALEPLPQPPAEALPLLGE